MKVTILNVDKVIASLDDYRKNMKTKINLFLERLCTIGAYRARIDFTNAMYAGNNDVEISVEVSGSGYKVVASGASVLFIEFGTGVINPEHPQSSEFGYIHGGYGDGKGANKKGWIYAGEQGNAGQPIRDGIYRTYGNPPAKAMYNAAKDMKSQILKIAQEVFSS